MPKKILLIEDSLDIRENTAEILSLADYEVITAANGKEGVSLAIAQKPDIIICDISMPILDGYGVYKLLSKNIATKHIPFIFLTAKAEKEDFRKAMEMGADDYLTKPFLESDLINAIETRLNKIKPQIDEQLNTENTIKVSDINEFAQFIESQNFDIKFYKKKEYIYKQNQQPKFLYFLKSGLVKNTVITQLHKEYISYIYNQFQLIGLPYLFTTSVYQEDAIVVEDAEIVLIPFGNLHKLLVHNQSLSNFFLQNLGSLMFSQQQKLASLAYNSVKKRTAEALIELLEKSEQKQKNKIPSFTREELANMIGTTTESVVRILTEFKTKGYIEINQNDIYIKQSQKLIDLKH